MASSFSSASARSWVNKARSQRSNRAVILFLIATTLISGCFLRVAYLQLVHGRYNRQLADQNRIRPQPLVADRGNLLDRKGKTLAANQLFRSIYAYPREQTKEEWATTAEKLSKVLDMPAQEILKKIETAKDGYRSAVPIRLFPKLNEKQFIGLSEIGTIKGLEVQPESNRYYPHGTLAAHVMGYIGEASLEELRANPDFPSGMLVGKMGIERIEDSTLRGVWGNRLIEVDSLGKELQMLGIQQPVPGTPLKLTLDLEMQKAAEKGLNNRRGAVVAMNVKTGGIMVMASGPTFDPGMFTRKITQKDWDRLQAPDSPLLNRTMQGYPPGSTFKVVTATAAMQSGKFKPDSTLMTYSAINIGGILFHEHGSGYGVIGFKEALTVSSNTFFYQLGQAVGPDEINKWGHIYGVGQTTHMGLEGGSDGVIPTPDQKMKLYNEPWYGGDTVSMAIGQGVVQVTPLELVTMYATIANNGKRPKPHLLIGQDTMPNMQPEQMPFDMAALKVIKAGLESVVKEGTARQLSDGSIPPTAGKTGTSEVFGQRDHALYAGYGPVNDPEIAIAVIVENGGFGAESAVPIAHQVFKAYFGPQKQPVKPKQ
jgi:penicillin-binding protein 2